ncbi:MAG: hypothetical protein FD123_413 [Bacteroidetes bacterium]|nr:MAG: hypothetical protein FD123_413 [Bacteroidota bacterium]
MLLQKETVEELYENRAARIKRMTKKINKAKGPLSKKVKIRTVF